MHPVCDHPGWGPTNTRAVRTPAGGTTATAEETGITLGPSEAAVDVYDPATLTHRTPAALRRVLAGHGPAERLRNPDLWDAIATAIIRQVIRADQARLMYQRFTAAIGEPINHVGERLHLFPTPNVVLSVDDTTFTRLGMAFKRRPLRAAAEAFGDLGVKWASLPPADLAAEIQSVPRIGPWTAGAAVADYTGDFSFYPYGDMAVRKYARQAAPSLALPDTEADFATRWRGYAGTPGELSALTVLTLALGGHRGKARPPV
ncbi:DNA-3-methyladenine glycosylase family protein [Nocardiopsis sediminis]|uniref:DNA-3-methyladenine glycosylase family protein n=1 Tax=Nocardiopsis sediminis TaxID=1778267 RepID=A0ABV8FMR1_9ACTN